MPRSAGTPNSHWALVADVLSARALVWVASVGRDADLTPQAHLYFADRYRRLADYHRAHDRRERAARLQAKADAHFRAGGGREGGGGEGPYAAAMAMPRPQRFVTNAVSRHRIDGPDDAA